MKGRLLVVDEDSLRDVKENKIWGPRIPQLGGNWDITIIDIISDMMNLHIGDYVVLWKTKNSIIDSSEFYGVYRVISKPYIDIEVREDICNDKSPVPFKIKIEEAYRFNNPIQEYDFINDINIKNDIWTIIGKKVKGKARASIPITDEIVQLFIKKFIDINSDWSYVDFTNEVVIPREKILHIDLSKSLDKDTSKLSKKEKNQKKINEANIFKKTYNMDLIKFTSEDGKDIRCEKVLEGVFNQYINDKLTGSILENPIDKIIYNNSNIKWYFNYLPYGLEGTEIDYMMALSADGVNISTILVLEFMKGCLDLDHIKRAFIYSKWVNTALCDNSRLAEPIVISNKTPKGDKLEEIVKNINIYKVKYGINKFRLFNYKVENNVLVLNEQFLSE